MRACEQLARDEAAKQAATAAGNDAAASQLASELSAVERLSNPWNRIADLQRRMGLLLRTPRTLEDNLSTFR